MLGVTADTNIYVSAYQFGGLPRRFVDLAAAGVFRLDISDAILNETLAVLRDKFQWNAEALRVLQDDIRGYTRHSAPGESLAVIKTDPSDNRILECAIAAKSDFIVSGDARHMLPLAKYKGIRIVKVSTFLETMHGHQ